MTTASRLFALAGYLAAVAFPTTAELAMAANSAAPEVSATTSPGDVAGLITTNDTLSEVMVHPDLASFSEHLVPRPGQSFDPEMALSDIGSLLPYHSNVHPDEVAAGLNRLASDARMGRRVFYPIYSDSQIAADPTKLDTGLFYFRAGEGVPFAIVAPGGGFAYVGSVHEGFPYATAINAEGYNSAPASKHRQRDGSQRRFDSGETTRCRCQPGRVSAPGRNAAVAHVSRMNNLGRNQEFAGAAQFSSGLFGSVGCTRRSASCASASRIRPSARPAPPSIARSIWPIAPYRRDTVARLSGHQSRRSP